MKENAASVIDPFELPAVPLERRDKLPNKSGIYFAVKRGSVLYVGKASNLRKRWQRNHDRFHLLDYIGGVRLAYLTVDDDVASLAEMAANFIKCFRPKFNSQHIPVEKPKLVRPSTGQQSGGVMKLMIKAVAQAKGFRNAKDLGDKAKIPNVSMYRLWNGTATRVDLATLEKLCEVLEVQPGMLIMHIPKVENPPSSLQSGEATSQPEKKPTKKGSKK